MTAYRISGMSMLAAVVLTGFTACDSDDDNNRPDEGATHSAILDFHKAPDLTYEIDGMWSQCLDPRKGDFDIGIFEFSHKAFPNNTWVGFSPSTSTDTDDHMGEWNKYQWSAITGGGPAGPGTPYIVAHFMPGIDNDDDHALEIELDDIDWFYPESVRVTNATSAYYTMLNGGPGVAAFGPADYLVVKFYGKSGRRVVGPVEADLASDTFITSDWTTVDLRPLGRVEEIYITLSSSQVSLPGYFALTGLQVRY